MTAGVAAMANTAFDMLSVARYLEAAGVTLPLPWQSPS